MQERNNANITGIDVSRHQGTIDWPKVAASGQRFAYVKASEGIGYTDPQFRRNAVGAPAAGLKVGFYHYCRPETGNTAKAEAAAFLEAVAGLPCDLPYVLDVEGAAASIGVDKLNAWCHEWLEIVEKQTKKRCMIYTGASFAKSYLGPQLAWWPLWVAHYGAQQPMANSTWSRWAVFQHSDAGNVSGITGLVDLNEMELDFWKELNGVAKPQIIKERIRAAGGKLEYIPLNTGKPYSIAATDVRLLRLEKGKYRLKFVARKDGKVSALVKEFGADFGINFPFFDGPSKLPVGTVWDGEKYVNGAFGKATKWHEFASSGGIASIGQLGQLERYDFAVQGSPLLVNNGAPVWDYYRALEEVASDIGRDTNGNLVRCQRTFVGVTATGDLLVAISDGRTSSDLGLTLEEMALYMLDKGAVVAINGDGGGSSIIADRSGGLNQSQNVGANERIVHHALLIYCQDDAPAGYKDSDPITYGDLKKLGLVK